MALCPEELERQQFDETVVAEVEEAVDRWLRNEYFPGRSLEVDLDGPSWKEVRGCDFAEVVNRYKKVGWNVRVNPHCRFCFSLVQEDRIEDEKLEVLIPNRTLEETNDIERVGTGNTCRGG